MKVAIYTACFGDHDKPADVPGTFESAEHSVSLTCFTDSPSLARELKTWQVRRMRARFKTPRMDAKWYKTSACRLFGETHELSIYVDSSVRFHRAEGFVDHCISALGKSPIAFYTHPEGQRSLIEEAQFSMTMGKYIGEPLIEQARTYAEVFPGGRLLAGGCIVRDHRPRTDGRFDRDDVCRFEKAWFDECVFWSAQDQISLPYMLWKECLEYSLLPGSIYQNDFFSRIWSGPDR